MSWKEDVLASLKDISDAILACKPDDKNGIMRIGANVETGMRLIPASDISKTSVQLALQSLVAVFQQIVADPKLIFRLAARNIRAVCRYLQDPAASADELSQGDSLLKQELARKADSPATAIPQGFFGDEPGGGSDVPAASDSPEPESACIDDLIAVLMTVASDDLERLASVKASLAAMAGSADTAQQAKGHLDKSIEELEKIIASQSADVSASINLVCEELGLASAAQESCETGMPETRDTHSHEPIPKASDSVVAAETKPSSPPVQESAACQAASQPSPAPTAQPAFDISFSGPALLPEETDMDLLKEFIIESLDHIVNAEAALLELEGNPGDMEQINRIFRAFHTIKGTSGFLGLDRIQKLAHLAESLLDRAREKEIAMTGGYADLALKSSDLLKAMMDDLKSAQPGGELKIPGALPELLEHLLNPEAAGYCEDAAPETMRLGEILVGKGVVTKDTVDHAIAEKGKKPLGEALVESGVAQVEDVAKALRVQKQQAPMEVEATVRVGTSRLDSLINMVGELVIAQSMVGQDPLVTSSSNPRLSRNVSHAGKIIRELQDLTMSLRMVPLKPTFQKMARLVRDVAKKAGKAVQFVTEGEETEIDRNMVEILGDPLVHMIRNAVDHGIEPPDVRAQTSKSETGTVTLRAYHSAGNVVIELQDDGKGLDKERILKKAIERKLIEPGHQLTDSEIYNLIFLPGFSTAEKVTDVSGRGVGMDVVKRNIDKIRGRIEMNSSPGRGSVFTIRLPLTMAITDAMLLRVGKERYLLPTVSIEQSFRPVASQISTVVGRGEMVMLRGNLLPLFRLHSLFNVSDAVGDPTEGLLIVIEGNGQRGAVMVDELLGQQQVVIKSLGENFAHVPGVSGGAILGDGRVGLILDASGMLALAQGSDMTLQNEMDETPQGEEDVSENSPQNNG